MYAHSEFVFSLHTPRVIHELIFLKAFPQGDALGNFVPAGFVPAGCHPAGTLAISVKTKKGVCTGCTELVQFLVNDDIF